MPRQHLFLLHINDIGIPRIPGGYVHIAPPTRDPFILRFAVEGSSTICRNGSLWVNIPEEGAPFRRRHFVEHKLAAADFDRNLEISITINAPGSYSFYFTHTRLPALELSPSSTDEGGSSDLVNTPISYIHVDPCLQLAGRPLPLPALSILSVISKFMGRYPDDWECHLRGISDRGYNMIHFAPLQVRGISKSPFSIYDQLAWDPESFPNGEADVRQLIESMETKHSLLSMTDIVLNHTANNTQWLQHHPEAGYNLTNAPWLEPAYVLEEELLAFGSRLSSLGLPTVIHTVHDLSRIMGLVEAEVLGKIKLWEYYTVQVSRDAEAAVDAWAQGKTLLQKNAPPGFDGRLQAMAGASLDDHVAFLRRFSLVGTDRMGERFRRRIEPASAASLLSVLCGPHDTDSPDSPDQTVVMSKMRALLNALNVDFYTEYNDDVKTIKEQLVGRIKYLRLDENGPKLGAICDANPLIESYFTRLPKNDDTAKHSPKDLVLVNNGWIWGGNALIDYASSVSRAYLRREVIVWQDCVKLRYGAGPEDNPWLWEHMTTYARMLAKYFVAFRIDNCHSTPIHVAEHILDAARSDRPDLYVIAELFTGSEEVDYLFIKRLGINSLVREAMKAEHPGALSRDCHRYGGRPMGSFEFDEVTRSNPRNATTTTNFNNPPGDGDDIDTKDGGSSCDIIQTIRPMPVPVLFMDCTHDNETPAQIRQARDTLPNAALVSMCATPIGSVMGYDDVYPKLLDLVHESHQYASDSSNPELITPGRSSGGIGRLRKILNRLRLQMGEDGYDEIHVHHEGEFITIHRMHPESRRGFFLIARTAFPRCADGSSSKDVLSPIHLSGTFVRHMGSWSLEVDASEEATARAMSDAERVRGLPSRVVDFAGLKLEGSGDKTIITVRDVFPPGSIALLETWMPSAKQATGLDTYTTSGADLAWADVDLIDLNFLMYRCETEELNASDGRDGVYDVPGHGKLVYAGFQGWWSVLKNIIHDNVLEHPLCRNLREGDWAFRYVAGRVERMSQEAGNERLAGPAKWLRDRFDAIRVVPSYLWPRYFGLVMRTAYRASWARAMQLMDASIRQGQPFLQSLAMVSVQQTGYVKSASLWPRKSVPSIAAGLPHFAVDWSRCWGRDVFISVRGLFLGTGRHDECREHILAFASVLKHGMIPNLLSSGDAPRYNSRDSIWFFLQAIQDYVRLVDGGIALLREKVKRRFIPYDDEWFPMNDSRAYSLHSTIEEVVQEAMQRHAEGMKYREANAGPQIDRQMRDEGFEQEIKVDWTTGFIFGGNQFNCGTWMDKMGESEQAGSKGIPGTPRDGAAVEITGLLYSTLVWLDRLHRRGEYSYAGVKTAEGEFIPWKDWAARIKANFERCYYVPASADEDAAHDINTGLVNRRGIYKDLYRSGKEYEDYQLRPNFPIAMTVAPALFDGEHAMQALLLADSVLRGPTGMATLDPSDLHYQPYYDNSRDTHDFETSKGRNYHQGPEWLWPTGFFLRALLKFDLARRTTAEGRTEAFEQVARRLAGCKQMMEKNPWAGLVELTNKHGQPCSDSAPTQAWSAACLIDLFMDAREEQQRIRA